MELPEEKKMLENSNKSDSQGQIIAFLDWNA